MALKGATRVRSHAERISHVCAKKDCERPQTARVADVSPGTPGGQEANVIAVAPAQGAVEMLPLGGVGLGVARAAFGRMIPPNKL